MTKKLYISGMVCNHCKKSVEETLNSLSGVKNVAVDLENACAVVETENDTPNSVFISAVEDKGFTVKTIE